LGKRLVVGTADVVWNNIYELMMPFLIIIVIVIAIEALY
jgi:hypothetical protein